MTEKVQHQNREPQAFRTIGSFERGVVAGNGNGHLHPIDDGQLVPQGELTGTTEHSLMNTPDTKDMYRTAVFWVDLKLWSEIEKDRRSGKEVDAEAEARLTAFGKTKDRQVRGQMGDQLTSSITDALRRRFNLDLGTLIELRTEKRDPRDEVNFVREFYENAFRSRPSDQGPNERQRLWEEAQHLRSDVDHLMAMTFEPNLKAWAGILAMHGASYNRVKEKIEPVGIGFAQASKKDQVAIARSFREKISMLLDHEFDHLLVDYGRIGTFNLHFSKNSASPSDWFRRFGEAKGPEERLEIIRKLHEVVLKNRSKAEVKPASLRTRPSTA